MVNDSDTRERVDAWEDCQPGSLQRYAAGQHATLVRRRWVSLGGTAAVAGLLMVAALSFTPWGQPNDRRTGPADWLTCDEVVGHVDAYLAGELAPELAQHVRGHLQHCGSCKHFYDQRSQAEGQELMVSHGGRVTPMQSTSVEFVWLTGSDVPSQLVACSDKLP